MISLTTIQRDLLCQLLLAERPATTAALGQQLHLTPRQVHYGLSEISAWLERRQVGLRHVRGVGIELLCSPERRAALLAELTSLAAVQLVLSSGQRQQLLAFQLLTACRPHILSQFQHALEVSRATAIKDLETIEPWLAQFGLRVARRQHRGIWLEGSELARRQALAALTWGDVPFDRPILRVSREQGISFALANDAALLPLAGTVNSFIAALDLRAARQWVERAEAGLGGRFAEEGVDELALAIALQRQRVATKQFVAWAPQELDWLQAQAAWPVATRLASELWPDLPQPVVLAEAAALAVQILACPRDEPWQPDLPANQQFQELLAALQAESATAYALPAIATDRLLREGLEAHLLPASTRRRFNLWGPTRPLAQTPVERQSVDQSVAARLAQRVFEATGIALPPTAEHELALLLHAAVVRARPERTRHVIVVCPSGMATTQLLVARLQARLPRLGTFEVLPLRALTAERVAAADLIISTVPLHLPGETSTPVVQVHPTLRSEDISALAQWMT